MKLLTSRPELLAMALAFLAGFGPMAGGLNPADGFVVLGLAWGATLLRTRFSGGLRPRPLLFAPFLAALFSLATALIPGLGVEWTARLLFYALVASAFAGALDDRRLLWALAAAITLLAGSVLVEATRDYLLLGRVGLGQSHGGLLLGANAAGLGLALSATPFYLLFADGGRWERLLVAALVAMAGVALVLTGSRTALIALGGGLIVPFLALSRRGRILTISLFLLVIATAAFAYLPRFLARFDPEYITNQQRIGMARTVEAGLVARPILGHGPWSYPVVSTRYQAWPKWELHPHSLGLRILFESGLVGVLAWLAFAAPLLRRGRRTLWRHPASFGIAAAILAGSLTDDLLWIPIFPLLLFLGLAPFVGAARVRSRVIATTALLIAGFLAAPLPFLHGKFDALPGAPHSRAIDRAVETARAPDFMGWEEDPIALRIAAFQALERGETRVAISRLRRVAEIDPMMIWTPNRLDLAWLDERLGDSTAAASQIVAARRLAPVLTAWYEGGRAAAKPSPIDRHYGIEFSDPSSITLAMVPASSDRLHWAHYRGRVAAALMTSDTPAARAALAAALALAGRQIGTDPVLCRLAAMLRPDEAAFWLERARVRNTPAYPWRIFAPLVYRQPVRTTGDNAPWRRGETMPAA